MKNVWIKLNLGKITIAPPSEVICPLFVKVAWHLNVLLHSSRTLVNDQVTLVTRNAVFHPHLVTRFCLLFFNKELTKVTCKSLFPFIYWKDAAKNKICIQKCRTKKMLAYYCFPLLPYPDCHLLFVVNRKYKIFTTLYICLVPCQLLLPHLSLCTIRTKMSMFPIFPYDS